VAIINLQSVSVEFPIYSGRNLKNQFIHLATGGYIRSDSKKLIVTALKNITLSIKNGDQIGLIGHNGSGKSTLLRVMSKIYEPTQGQIKIQGQISCILDLLQGIEAEFTGYDNIQMRGTLMGLTRQEIHAKKEEIAEFSGLGDYLSMPVRTYSSGMKMRLAFAVSASIKPEILLIDEVFGAGDTNFLEKARKKMSSLMNESRIVVLASHTNNLIKDFCNKAILLERGSIKYFGAVQTALDLYNEGK